MRIKFYNVKQEKELHKPFLVCEKQINYPQTKKLANPYDISKFMFDYFKADELAEEYVWMITTDTDNNLNGIFEISHGGINHSSLPKREICQKALLSGAVNVVLIHNHPSGNPTPSNIDKAVTKEIFESIKTVGVQLIDHIVLGDNNYFSFAEQNLV